VVPAGAGVHRADELETGRVIGAPRRAGDVDAPRFKRLAQDFEHLAVEFGQFIQEENAMVRKTDFAGSGQGTAVTSTK
jgi:hypothetical protein